MIVINMENKRNITLYVDFLNCVFVHMCLHVCRHTYKQQGKNLEGETTKILKCTYGGIG